jgi:hypothetical protein
MAGKNKKPFLREERPLTDSKRLTTSHLTNVVKEGVDERDA